MTLDIAALRADFPALHQEVHGQPLVYLDSGASAQKPQAVIDVVAGFYQRDYANIHRGVHELSRRATDAYHAARRTVQRYVNAPREEEIIFTRGATEAINLVAESFVAPGLTAGDAVVVTQMEHHANIVPWQRACERAGAELRVWPIDSDGSLQMQALPELLQDNVKMLAVTHVSNVLGTVNPVAEITAAAKAQGIPVLIDGAQAVPHGPVDVQAIGCDFYVFSAHKVYGPTGVGVLFGRHEYLCAMPPYQTGGDMIASVSFEQTTYKAPPERFEAGTPNIAGAVGLAAALDYVSALPLNEIHSHEQALLHAATEALTSLPGVTIQGNAARKAPVVSFTVDSVHPHDLATICDMHGVAIRAGHHCAEPLMRHLGVPATARASMAFYNSIEDIETLARAVRAAIDALA